MKKVPFKNISAVFLALPTALVILIPKGFDFIIQRVTNAFQNLTGMEYDDLVDKPFFKTISRFDNTSIKDETTW